MESKVSASTKEFYSGFQAAETAISVAQRTSGSFSDAITAGTPIIVPMDSAAGLYPNTALSARVSYNSEGTVAFNSSIGTFKPLYFTIEGNVVRTGSKGSATHIQGYRVLAPSS